LAGLQYVFTREHGKFDRSSPLTDETPKIFMVKDAQPFPDGQIKSWTLLGVYIFLWRWLRIWPMLLHTFRLDLTWVIERGGGGRQTLFCSHRL
jgi:hypothetical protein